MPQFIDATLYPYVGMPATCSAGSDSYPYTVVEVSDNLKTIGLRRCDHEPDKSGDQGKFDYYSNQVYIYTENEDSPVSYYTLRKNGKWIPRGTPLSAYWAACHLGHRRYKQDPHF